MCTVAAEVAVKELEDVECDQCDYRSTNSWVLRKHMEKQHKNIPQMVNQ